MIAMCKFVSFIPNLEGMKILARFDVLLTRVRIQPCIFSFIFCILWISDSLDVAAF